MYGMLRRGGGHSLSDHAPGARFIADADVGGNLYDMGEYPALIPGDSAMVKGEVWEVSENVLTQLDDFEASAGYSRHRTEVFIDGTEHECWVYTPSPDRCAAAKLIDSGDWISYIGRENS